MLPNLIIIGAGKCGTSALYYYLHQHPEVTMSREKELRFFGSRWRRGLAWYESHFADCRTPVRGEASPQYTHYPGNPEAPRRMHDVVPGARLIYLVRDPLERIVSHYVDSYSLRREHRRFRDAAWPTTDNRYVHISSYATQLERYLPHFALEQILVIDRDELLERRRAALARLFAFLGVDPSFDSPLFDRVRNRSEDKRRVRWDNPLLPRKLSPSPGGRLPWAVRARVKRTVYRSLSVAVDRPDVDDDLRDALGEVLQPEAERLRALTGKRLSSWSV